MADGDTGTEGSPGAGLILLGGLGAVVVTGLYGAIAWSNPDLTDRQIFLQNPSLFAGYAVTIGLMLVGAWLED